MAKPCKAGCQLSTVAHILDQLVDECKKSDKEEGLGENNATWRGVWDLIVKQGARCYLSGILLELNGIETPDAHLQKRCEKPSSQNNTV